MVGGAGGGRFMVVSSNSPIKFSGTGGGGCNIISKLWKFKSSRREEEAISKRFFFRELRGRCVWGRRVCRRPSARTRAKYIPDDLWGCVFFLLLGGGYASAPAAD